MEQTQTTPTEATPTPTQETPIQPAEQAELDMVAAAAAAKVSTPEPETAAKKIPISEMYVCTQGEGPLVGTPSVLVRVSGCNLRCCWTDPTTGKKNICDTPFTSWKPENDIQLTTQRIYDETINMALNDNGKRRKHPITHVIISGGEPCLYGTDMSDLILAYLVTGMHVTVETNGTKYIEVQSKQKTKDGREIDLSGNVLFSISPKLESSTPVGTNCEKMHSKNRMNEVVLEALLKRYPSYLKFVVASDTDLDEIQGLQNKLKLPSHRIFLMPQGITREEIVASGAKVNEICIANSYRYSPREHVILYDNKRKT
jgi:7-carboxy-7-deazaguanine synthase